MPVDAKQFAGVMDLDSSPETIGKGIHREARNVTFRGVGSNKRAENVPGNRLLPNALLPAGNNLTVMRLYDPIKKRIYFFNQNSNGNHGIYLFNTIPKTFQRLVEVGVNTNGDVLDFTSTNFICNANIIYGDVLQGDQLFWLNCQGVPSKINVDRALAGGYGTFEQDFLEVATAPASIPPYVVYEDDATVTVNNLRKKLFKFKIRWVQDDNEKTVTSIQSEIPVPYDPFEPDVDTDVTLNSRIAVVYQTGPANVKKIEILGAVSVDNAFSDFFLIASLDKVQSSIPDNDIAVFNFYNDQAYNYIDVPESIQLFDYVPQNAVSQELLNGNVPVYGNYVEGYPNLTEFGDSNVEFGSEACYEGRYFSLLVGSQSGDSGFGTGNIHAIVKGRVTISNIYILSMTDNTSISYTAGMGDTITDVLQGLIDDATLQGYTVTGSTATPDEIYFSLTGKVLAFARLIPNGGIENIENSADGSLMAYDWWSRYGYGLVYFDPKGRTNGVVYPQNVFSGQTTVYEDFGTQANIPILLAQLSHTPPDWAYYYTWVRTKNLTKTKFLQWISDRTLKDTSTDPNEVKYAYISIENLNAFRAKNPTSPLIYDFAPNDRIRFMKRVNADGSVSEIYDTRDYEIQGQEINPTINGVLQTGQFVKIFLPTTDAAFDFGGSDDTYAYYFFELYTPAQSVANGLDVYYEFGERYKIINPTLSTRMHQGQTQNQTISEPAEFSFIKGDDWTRFRKIQAGVELSYSIPATACMDSDAGRITMGVSFLSASVADPNVLTGNSPCQNLVGFNISTNDSRWIIKIVTGTYSFRIKGSVTIVFSDSLPGDSYEFFLEKNDGTRISLVAPFDSSVAGTYTFTYDATFTMTTGERIFFFGWSVPESDHTRTFQATSFTITRTLAFTQTMIDPNFSDYYPSAVNSNGRAFVYDPNAARITYKNHYRWGLAFQDSSNINQTNRFYPLNFDQIDLSRGGIMRFKVYERILRIYQERKCGRVGIYQRFVTQADGSVSLITSNEIITKNNIEYYAGDNGIGNQPDSLTSDGFRDYFIDPIRGNLIRVSLDGLEVISEVYNAQTYVGNRSILYLSDNLYALGGRSRISGVINDRKDLPTEYMSLFQSIKDPETPDILYPGECLVFNEKSNGFERFDDKDADCMVCAENTLYAFRGGQLYIFDDYTNCANYYGVQYQPSVKMLFNDQVALKKVFQALAYQGNAIWECSTVGDINTSMINPQTGDRQQSKLVAADFQIQENVRYSEFLRDVNSMADADVALWEGDFLNGNWIEVNLRYRGNAYVWLFLAYINYQLSPRNL